MGTNLSSTKTIQVLHVNGGQVDNSFNILKLCIISDNSEIVIVNDEIAQETILFGKLNRHRRTRRQRRLLNGGCTTR